MRLSKVLFSPLVIVFTFTALLAQNGDKLNRADGGGAISGRVVAQGKPLAGAVITLWEQPLAEPTEHNVRGTGRTDEEGKYELKQVAAGNYFISATAPGFVTGRENQILANLRFVNAVGNARVEGVNFELIPEGLIKGEVTDADGQPLARIPINVFAEAVPVDAGPPQYARDIRTDGQGRYRINGLPAGKYRVAAGYQLVSTATVFGRAGYRRTFFGGAAEEAQATVIEIAAGSEIADVNINVGRPVKTYSVRAKIIDSQSEKPIDDIDYSLDAYLNGKRIGGTTTRALSDKNGEITIENVPPGEYVIRIPGGSGAFPTGKEIPPAPNLFGESKHFEVIDRNPDEIEIRVVKAATVSGFVAVEGPASMDLLAKVPQMSLVAMVIMSPIIRATIKPDGSFLLTGIKPGTLRFNFLAPATGVPLPLRLARTERDGVKLDHDLDIHAGDQITGVRLVLAYANSSVHGLVKLGNSPLPENIVATASILRDGSVIEGAKLNIRGEFLLQHLPAGEYTLAVSAHDVNNRGWRVEQPIVLADDKVSEATMVLDSKAAATPTQRPVVPR